MTVYVPRCGDFIWLDFDPSAGREIQKRRPALIVSHEANNRLTGFSLCVPITSTVRGGGLEVPLVRQKVKGVALPYQARFLDMRIRNPEFIGKSSQSVLEEVLARLHSMIGTEVEK